MLLIDFSEPDAIGAWEAMTDQVMGGLSRCALTHAEGTTARFSGELSLKNRGGFASVRWSPGHFDLQDAAGLKLRCRGDGQVYKISLRLEKSLDGIAWQARFETVVESWDEIELHFDDFHPTWRGHPVPHAPLFDPSRIASIGLLIGDRQEGPFCLDITWIRTLPPGDAA